MKDGAPALVLGSVQIVEITPDDAALYHMDSQALASEWRATLVGKMRQLQPLYLRESRINIKVLSENRVLLLVLQVGMLLLGATIGGELFARLKLPPVLGQLAAGIVLGLTVLGSIFPEAFALIGSTVS